jgi:hypothetical protein
MKGIRETWSAACKIEILLGYIYGMLSDPSEHGLVAEIASEYRTAQGSFNAKARAWTDEFATDKKSADSDSDSGVGVADKESMDHEQATDERGGTLHAA